MTIGGTYRDLLPESAPTPLVKGGTMAETLKTLRGSHHILLLACVTLSRDSEFLRLID